MSSTAEVARHTASVRGRDIGSQISGVFGLVFVWVNSATVPTPGRVALTIIACGGFLAILALSIRSYRAHRAVAIATPLADNGDGGARSPFGRAYWIILLIEMIALFGGGQLITRLGYPEFGVAWVAVVVGTHFFALARLFRLARFHLLGAIVTLLGLAGFALGQLGAPAAIAFVSGVASGFALLVFGLWAFAPNRSQPSA